MKPAPKMPAIGKVKARFKTPPSPIGMVQGEYSQVISFPMRIESTLNKREHWAVRHRRNKSQKDSTKWALFMFARPRLPCAITLTRIAPRQLDRHDNLTAGFKGVVDAIAEWLGVDDSDERIEWLYAQRRGRPNEYAVEVEFRELGVAEDDSAEFDAALGEVAR